MSSSVTASHPIATSAATKNVAGNVPRLILLVTEASGFIKPVPFKALCQFAVADIGSLEFGLVAGNRALSSGKCDGGAAMRIYNQRPTGNVTKRDA